MVIHRLILAEWSRWAIKLSLGLVADNKWEGSQALHDRVQ